MMCSFSDNTCRTLCVLHYLLVLSQAEGVVPAVEGNELRLEENVTVDAEVALGGLNTAEAGCWICVSLKSREGRYLMVNTHCFLGLEQS